MSKIDELIGGSPKREPTVPFTVRIAQSQLEALDKIADELGTFRQTLVTAMISDGLVVLQAKLLVQRSKEATNGTARS